MLAQSAPELRPTASDSALQASNSAPSNIYWLLMSSCAHDLSVAADTLERTLIAASSVPR
jgi:hypothetical protein